MAEGKRQPVAESHQKVQIQTRSLTRKQSGDKNYPTLYTGKIIIKDFVRGVKTMTIRNFRRLSY